MSRIVITDSNQFKSLINTFESSSNRIKEIFAKEKTNIEKINATDIWTGNTQEVIYDKHVQLQKNFAPIGEALDYYVAFLRKTVDDYEREEANIIKNAEENNFELDVNSSNFSDIDRNV